MTREMASAGTGGKNREEVLGTLLNRRCRYAPVRCRVLGDGPFATDRNDGVRKSIEYGLRPITKPKIPATR